MLSICGQAANPRFDLRAGDIKKSIGELVAMVSFGKSRTSAMTMTMTKIHINTKTKRRHKIVNRRAGAHRFIVLPYYVVYEKGDCKKNLLVGA